MVSPQRIPRAVSRSKFYVLVGLAIMCFFAIWLHHQHVFFIGKYKDQQEAAPTAITKAVMNERRKEGSGILTKYAVLSACQVTSEPHKYMFTGTKCGQSTLPEFASELRIKQSKPGTWSSVLLADRSEMYALGCDRGRRGSESGEQAEIL
eukprot:6951962-Pyramimonas_sp.AAC.1